MREPSKERRPTSSPGVPYPALRRCLSLDLEISRHDSILLAAAAFRPDSEKHLSMPRRPKGRDLERFDRLAENASFLLGHNIIPFDLPHLRALNPRLRLLKLPAVDTLRLNPLAFPQRPYHHLVKHYKDAGSGPKSDQRSSPGQQVGRRGLRKPVGTS